MLRVDRLVAKAFPNRRVIGHELLAGGLMLDVGHFLRYEQHSKPLREPHFSRAFVNHGGYLPDCWPEIVKLIDLTGLVECLTHEQLPAEVEAELFALINATLTLATQTN